MMSRPMQNTQPMQGGQGMNIMQMLQNAPQFVQQIKGLNKTNMLNQIVASGKINQNQLNQAHQIANQNLQQIQASGQLEQFKAMFGIK